VQAANHFLKGEGGVMRVLHISAKILYVAGMLRGRVMSCPKKQCTCGTNADSDETFKQIVSETLKTKSGETA
jgi:hypothetical protein